MKILIISLLVSVLISPISPLPAAHSLTLGCSKAQAEAQRAGSAASVSIQSETRYVERSDFTQAYQEYLFANRFTNEWKKIVTKSPKCFKNQYKEIHPIFKKFYDRATMCERYGRAICERYPSKPAPRKPTTLADVCGSNSFSDSYRECIERLGEADRYDYVD